jgi:hypothetical protein
MRTKFLAGAALVAIGSLWLTPAFAAPAPAPSPSIEPSGEMDGGYSYIWANNNSRGVNNWNLNGAVMVPVASNWGVQANAGYNSLSQSGINEDTGSVAGHVFYSQNWGRFGGSVAYSNTTVSNLSLDVTSYGVFGDWYAGDRVTVSARGGGISGTARASGVSANLSGGGYAGAQIVGYAMPNLAINGTVDYVTLPLHHNPIQGTTVGIGGEYLFSQSLPISLSAGYSNTQLRFRGVTASDNAVTVSLKYYFGGSGSLEDHQRTGSENWASSAPAVGLVF